MTKIKELEAVLVNAADLLVKMRSAMKVATNGAKAAGAIEALLATPEAKTVFKWRREHRLELKEVDTVDAKVVTSAVRNKRPVAPADKPAAGRGYEGKTIQVRTKQFTITSVFSHEGERCVVLDNGYIYRISEIEKTPEGKSDLSIKKGVLRIRGVKPPVAGKVSKESAPDRAARHDKEHKIIAKVATQTGRRALAKAEKDLAPKSAKEAGAAARVRRAGTDGVKGAAARAAKTEGFNANRARAQKASTGKKKIARG
ncbi:hypothetical protein D3C85_372960 [compost metagenome]